MWWQCVGRSTCRTGYVHFEKLGGQDIVTFRAPRNDRHVFVTLLVHVVNTGLSICRLFYQLASLKPPTSCTLSTVGLSFDESAAEVQHANWSQAHRRAEHVGSLRIHQFGQRVRDCVQEAVLRSAEFKRRRFVPAPRSGILEPGEPIEEYLPQRRLDGRRLPRRHGAALGFSQLCRADIQRGI